MSSSDLLKYSDVNMSAQEARTQTWGQDLSPAFITVSLNLIPAINTELVSALNRSLHTMHIIPLSKKQPSDTRKHPEIQTEHCVEACAEGVHARWK